MFFFAPAKDAKAPILNLEQGRSVAGWGQMIFYAADVDAFWTYLRGNGVSSRESERGVMGRAIFPHV